MTDETADPEIVKSIAQLFSQHPLEFSRDGEEIAKCCRHLREARLKFKTQEKKPRAAPKPKTVKKKTSLAATIGLDLTDLKL